MEKEYDVSRLRKGFMDLGIVPDEGQIRKFIDYHEILAEWNQVMNLTAVVGWEEVCTKHFIDSLSLCKAVDCSKQLSVIDVGTGAGFPGVPLKIIFPELKVTLLDSLGKRVRFLNEVIESLGLEDIEAIHGRAEDLAKDVLFREHYDLCVSRAVAHLSILSEYCLPYVKQGGFFVSYKSEKVLEEKASAGRAIQILGGEVCDQVRFMLPDSDIHRDLVVIRKIKATPKKYPRKAGTPSKEPL